LQNQLKWKVHNLQIFMNTQPILTIAIPTYNRATYLHLCLEQFCSQISKNNEFIELIVSNNCSTDDTENVVQQFVNRYSFIRYNKQSENKGADANFVWCFNDATGKYVWIFGDDDVLLDNKLNKILNILKSVNPDILYVKGYGYRGENYLEENPTQKPILSKSMIQHFKTGLRFIKKVHYYVTFASGSIVNKNIIPKDYNSADFIGTNLVQTSWIFETLISGKKFTVLNENIMAIKTNNTGGYKLFQTFCSDFNKIMNHYIAKAKMPKRFKTVINFNLLLSFFPQYILMFKKESKNKFLEENPKKILNIVYKYNFWYYVFIWPLFILPLKLGNFYQKIVLNNFNRFLNAFY
jgi:abequosyltransferase